MVASALIVVLDARGEEPFSNVPVAVRTFDAGTLHVDCFGSGDKPLVLIPGLGCGSWVWHDTIAKFSPSHTVYVVTLPGFNGRPAAKETSLFAAFSRDFWKMLEAQKIEKPMVVGHSLGGTLGIALAEEHPERLVGVVAVDGLPVFPMLARATEQQRSAMASRMASQYESLSKEGLLAAQKEFMRKMGTNKPELVEPAARLSAQSDPKAMAEWMREAMMADLRPNLKKITIPLLEIVPYEGREAASTPYTQEQTLAFYKSLLAGAPKARAEIVAPSRHFVMFDQQEAFHKLVEQFLSSLD